MIGVEHVMLMDNKIRPCEATAVVSLWQDSGAGPRKFKHFTVYETYTGGVTTSTGAHAQLYTDLCETCDASFSQNDDELGFQPSCVVEPVLAPEPLSKGSFNPCCWSE